jgi:glycosyltransferase involved in cell wall biosynthesis
LRYLILRAHPSRSRADFYNCQELGLAAHLRAQGLEVGLAGVFDDDVERLVPGLRYHPLQFWPRHPAFALVANLAALGLQHYDVVQLTDLCLPGNLQVIRRAPPSTRILLYQGHYPEPLGHGRWLRVLQSRLAARALRRRPHATLAKNGAAAAFVRDCGLQPAPVAGVGLVPDNLIAAQSPPPAVHDFVRRAAFTFLYVGHLSPRRPLEWVLPHLRHPSLAHASLLVVGGGPAREQLQRAGADLIAAGRLLIAGYMNQSQLGALYREVHAVVLPTRFEIFGMVCLEAMLFGLPLVASDAAGPAVVAARFPDRVRLVSGGANPRGWVEAMQWAMTPARRRVEAERDVDLRRALSWAGPGHYFEATAAGLAGRSAASGGRHE